MMKRNTMIKPYNNRKFGVEIECFGGDTPDLPRGWGHHYDGSVDDTGDEFVSPPTGGEEGFESVKEACEALREAGFSVNRSCGLHTHYDFTNLTEKDLKKVVMAYLLYDDFFWRMLPESRRENHYCRKAKGEYIDFIENLQGSIKKNRPGRYTSINTQAYSRHGTLEIRSHTGTLSATKILNWINMHLRFQEWALKKTFKEILKHRPSTHTWFQEILQDKELINYYKERESLFNNDRRKDFVKNINIRYLDGYKTPLNRNRIEELMRSMK